MNSEWVWLGLTVLFAVAEAATAALVSLWFIGGSLAALIAALCGAPLWLQIVLFFAVSGLLLLLLRPLVRRTVDTRKTVMNAESNVGKVVLVTERIDNLHETGAVKISGVEWSARSADGSVIEVGTAVRVAKLESAKVLVERAEVQTASRED